MNDDAIDSAYNELGKNLKTRHKMIAARANRKLNVFADRAIAAVDKNDVDDAIVQLSNSGFFVKNNNGRSEGERLNEDFSIGKLFAQETVFSHYAQCIAPSFKNAPDILAIDIRDRDATMKLAENKSFKELSARGSQAWTVRCNALLRDISVMGTICNLLEPLEMKLQSTRPARSPAHVAVRADRAGPNA